MGARSETRNRPITWVKAVPATAASRWQQFDSAAPVNDTVWWAPENATEPPEFSLNFARYKNLEVGTALARFRQNEDPAIQREAIATVQRLMGTDVPHVWLYHAQFAIIAPPRSW